MCPRGFLYTHCVKGQSESVGAIHLLSNLIFVLDFRNDLLTHDKQITLTYPASQKLQNTLYYTILCGALNNLIVAFDAEVLVL